MKRTPLYEVHCSLGGKMVDFGGWELPIQYTGIIEEHQQVRNAAGLFDVSHMGEITVKGTDAEKMIENLITNSILKAKEYQVVYSPMCYPDGGVVDDLLVYKFSNQDYLLVVNASNIDKDFSWIKQNMQGYDVDVQNVSDQYAQLALQGPKAEEILQKLVDIQLKEEIKFFYFKPNVMIDGIKAMVSRTGYTGEDGFEIYIKANNAATIWGKLLEAGKAEGLIPVGLGARDTLRLEAALPLYGHELTKDISPIEAGLEKFVKLDKNEFIGKAALINQKDAGVCRKLVGFEMGGRGIARSNYGIQVQGNNIGFVTSGSFSPTLNKNIGLALVEVDYSKEDIEIDIVIRNKLVRAKIIKTPFITKKYKK